MRQQPKPDLPSPLVAAARTWLEEFDGDTVPDVDVQTLLLRADDLGIAPDDPHALEERLLSYQSAIAVSPDGLNKYLLLPQGNWSGQAQKMTGDLVVIPAHEDQAPWVASWDKLRDNEEFWLKKGAFVFSPLFDEACELPFCFDGEDWAGTHYDYAFGHTEWTVQVNAEKSAFNLEEKAPRLSKAPSRPPGTWLKVECDGTSMSTGDIGTSISIDDEGGLWVYDWGYIMRYLGHASAEEDIVRVLREADGEFSTSSTVALSSDTLTPQEMRRVLDYIAETQDNYPYCKLEDFEVWCVDFDGSAADLLKVTEGMASSHQPEIAGESQPLVVVTAYDSTESARFRRLKRKPWVGEILGARGEWRQTVYHQGDVSFSIRSTADGRFWALHSEGFPRKIEAVVEASRETCAEEVAAEAMQAVKDAHGPYLDLIDDYRDLDSDLFLDYQKTARERSRQRKKEQEASSAAPKPETRESTAVPAEPEESCHREETSPQDIEPGVPADATFLCTVEVYAEIVTVDLTFHIHRAGGSDTLWMTTSYGRTGKALGANPTQGSVDSAGLGLVETAMHCAWHFGKPAGGFTPGLLTEAQVLNAWSRVQEEKQRLLEQAVMLTGDSEIVAAARELRLDPEPSGTGPASWYARCPGTKHYLRIQAESGQFGCGYCNQKGGVEELRQFVRTRR